MEIRQGSLGIAEWSYPEEPPGDQADQEQRDHNAESDENAEGAYGQSNSSLAAERSLVLWSVLLAGELEIVRILFLLTKTRATLRSLLGFVGGQSEWRKGEPGGLELGIQHRRMSGLGAHPMDRPRSAGQ